MDEEYDNSKLSISEPVTPHSRISNKNDNRTPVRAGFPGAGPFQFPPTKIPSSTSRIPQASTSLPGSTKRSRSGWSNYSGTNRFSLTPIRRQKWRVSDQFQSNVKKRRTSLVKTGDGKVSFNAKYNGSITVDYLKLFCKVTLEERKHIEKDKGSDNETREIPISSNTVKLSPGTLSRDPNTESRKVDASVDKSLPLRDESIESPKVAHKDNPFLILTQNDALDMRPPKNIRSPRPLSYLDRILQNRKNQNMVSQEQEATKEKRPLLHHPMGNEEESLFSQELSTSEFVDDQEKHTRPDVEIGQTNQRNFTTEEKAPIAEQEPEEKYNKYEVSSISTDKEAGGFRFDITDVDSKREEYEQAVSLRLEPNDFEEHKSFHSDDNIRASTPDGTNFHNNIEGTYTPDFVGTDEAENPPDLLDTKEPQLAGTPMRLIEEEFTLDNGLDIETNEHLFDQSHQVLEPRLNESLDARSQGMIYEKEKEDSSVHAQSNGRTSSHIPLTLVKRIMKTLPLIPNEVKTGSAPSKSKIKKINFGSNMHRLIQKCSDDFLDSLVGDLDAYASHRSAEHIGIKDVLLYLHRIKFGTQNRDNASTIERVSSLAERHLPLELLIALNNDLESLSSRKKGSRKNQEILQ